LCRRCACVVTKTSTKTKTKTKTKEILAPVAISAVKPERKTHTPVLFAAALKWWSQMPGTQSFYHPTESQKSQLPSGRQSRCSMIDLNSYEPPHGVHYPPDTSSIFSSGQQHKHIEYGSVGSGMEAVGMKRRWREQRSMG
jgi:hypothetical protein